MSILSRQCLERCILDEAALQHEITVYEDTSNAAKATVAWRFTTPYAREKLRCLYPSNSK